LYRVVAALGRRAVAGDAVDLDADLHPAALAAIDAVVGRLGGDDEFRLHALLLDEVEPAEAVAVLLLHRAGHQVGEALVEQAEVAGDGPAVDRRHDAAELVGAAAAADDLVVLKALEGVEVPVGDVADADRVDVPVKGDEGRA